MTGRSYKYHDNFTDLITFVIIYVMITKVCFYLTLLIYFFWTSDLKAGILKGGKEYGVSGLTLFCTSQDIDC